MTDYREIIYDAIHDAWSERLETVELETCIRDAMFLGADICRALKTGLVESLPVESDVLDAIAAGTYYAISEKNEANDGQTDQKNQKSVRQRRAGYKKIAKDGQEAR